LLEVGNSERLGRFYLADAGGKGKNAANPARHNNADLLHIVTERSEGFLHFAVGHPNACHSNGFFAGEESAVRGEYKKSRFLAPLDGMTMTDKDE